MAWTYKTFKHRAGKWIKGIFMASILGISPLWAQAATFANHYQTAVVAYEKGQYALAVQECQITLKLHPGLWKVYQLLCESYEGLGKRKEALAAAQESLKLHPENPALEQYAQKLQSLLTEEEAAKGSLPEKSDEKAAPASKLSDSKFWVKVYGGYTYGGMGDFNQSAAVRDDNVVNVNRAEAGHDGTLATLEFGIPLDRENGLALDLSGGWFDPLVADESAVTMVSSSSVTYKAEQNLAPYFTELELSYYHFWNQPSGRFYLKGSAGYGWAIVNAFSQRNYPTAYANLGDTEGPIDLASANFCFEGGLGYEWMLSPGLGLEISGLGRYAYFPQFTGYVTSTNPSGTVLYSGVVGLYQGPKGVVQLDHTDIPPKNSNWASVDYSGFSTSLSLNAYFF